MTREEAFASLSKSFGEKIQSKAEFRGETTYTIAAGDLREISKILSRRTFVRLLARHHEHRQFRRGTAFRDRLRVVFDAARGSTALETAHLGRRRRGRHGFRYLADGELARARNLRHDGNQVQGTPRSAPDLNVGRLPFFPLRKDFPLEGLPSEMPDVAFTKVTSMEGGPFVTRPSTATAKDREPRAHPPQL